MYASAAAAVLLSLAAAASGASLHVRDGGSQPPSDPGATTQQNGFIRGLSQVVSVCILLAMMFAFCLPGFYCVWKNRKLKKRVKDLEAVLNGGYHQDSGHGGGHGHSGKGWSG
ncbi:hypothetical protein H4R18_000783 [Coemansia javaensis]|uniref:Uncharacterized protein n=1 Tax=Coemansia javaensis TaxID=2761396 RepID=A0A9W8HMI1_9FUNG|nr:hypothetical protein H4R18_000783 [Coemansia javaensis]